MHVELDAALAFDEVADRLDRIEDRIQTRMSTTGQVFIEADAGRQRRRTVSAPAQQEP